MPLRLAPPTLEARQRILRSRGRIDVEIRSVGNISVDLGGVNPADYGNADLALLVKEIEAEFDTIITIKATAKRTARTKRMAWTKEHVSALKTHSRQKTPIVQIARQLKRSAGAIRQKALSLGLPVGHRR
jgi:hypothetical protein